MKASIKGGVVVFGGVVCALILGNYHPASAEQSSSHMCEWEDHELIGPNGHAHSTHCTAKPPQGDQDDWRVISYGEYTNIHSIWVYTTIADEGGAQHTLIN